MTFPNITPKSPALLSEEELQEILSRAAETQSNKPYSREQLSEIAEELGISEDALKEALREHSSLSGKLSRFPFKKIALIATVIFGGYLLFTLFLYNSSSISTGSVTELKRTVLLNHKKQMKISVLPFANQTGISDYSGIASSCADALLPSLSKLSNVTLIERLQLEKVIEELELNQSKFIDPTQAVEIGKLSGADYSVTGSLQKVGDDARIQLRLISTATGDVIFTQNIKGKFNNLFDLQDKLAVSLCEKLVN